MEEIVLIKPFITLGQLLQVSGFANSGVQAKFLLQSLAISVNNLKENRRGRKLFAGDVVNISDRLFLIKDGNSQNTT